MIAASTAPAGSPVTLTHTGTSSEYARQSRWWQGSIATPIGAAGVVVPSSVACTPVDSELIASAQRPLILKPVGEASQPSGVPSPSLSARIGCGGMLIEPWWKPALQ